MRPIQERATFFRQPGQLEVIVKRMRKLGEKGKAGFGIGRDPSTSGSSSGRGGLTPPTSDDDGGNGGGGGGRGGGRSRRAII